MEAEERIRQILLEDEKKMITKREVLERVTKNGHCNCNCRDQCPYFKEKIGCKLLKIGAMAILRQNRKKTEPRVFDKSKILTCVNAKNAKVGMNGYFGVTIFDIEQKIKSSEIDELQNVENSTFKLMSFQRKSDGEHFPLFYPIDEVTECTKK